MKNVIIWGGTGNFKVVKEIIEAEGNRVVALFDNNPGLQNPSPEVPFPGGKDALKNWISTCGIKNLYGVVAIGGKYGRDRCEIQQILENNGINILQLVHKTAYVSKTATLGEGTQVYAMASVCADARIGNACVINTAASVDHDCIVGDGVFIGPGARLAGEIRVGNFADIYTGAVILPRVSIGEAAVVGAGAVVLDDVAPFTVVAGNPAKMIKLRDH